MGIADEDIVKVRDAADIVAIINQHTTLRRVGQRWTGLCPFHNEKSPSFSVNQNEGLFYCFGCQKSGDVITFVREIEHLDFVGAVEWLAAKVGIVLTYTDRDEGAGRRRQKQLHDVMERAVEWYRARLNAPGPDAGAARRYLRSRGFDREMVEQFQVGWAPDSWDELCRFLKVPDDVLVDCGLGFRNKASRQQDFFRARVLFPIFDDQGRPVAFGGRKLPDTDGPKYQNSRETKLYNKSATLYGLNWAKADIVNANEAVICEGYTDVIGFFRAGIPRAVATCGTALTEDHIRSLKRFTRRIILAYDADEAGQNAAEKVYAWEQTHDIEVHVLSLPKGADPDELSRENPEALADAVSTAKPFLAFRVQRVLDAADVATPEGRARAASAALDVIAEHPSPFLRDQYLMEVAGFTRVDEHQLRTQLAAGPRPKPQVETQRRRRRGETGNGSDEPPPWVGSSGNHGFGDDGFGGDGYGDDGAGIGHGGGWAPASNVAPTAGSQRRSSAPLDGPQLEALRMIIHRRYEIEEWLRPVLFGDVRARAVYESIAVHPDLASAIAAIDERGDPELSGLVARLSVEETEAPVDDVVSLLLVDAAMRASSRFEAEARTSEDPLAYAPLISWLKLRLDSLRGDEASMEFAPELLAWLDENSAELS
ncbi:MAG: DNA primase [Microthrixaceae bacterium]|nr:DNA primase [Microthrixaceae bacterium]